jgi:hypothetical protein
MYFADRFADSLSLSLHELVFLLTLIGLDAWMIVDP